ncbi:MAG: T9SS type B sorting domain-containing protein [Flavobacterium sp.]|nr:MAG: T9SS type B sorting domain-containing protein [Flavobacterium sp.]
MNFPGKCMAALLFSVVAASQNIQVDDTYTAQQLVQDVLVNSPCANVSNFTVSGDSFSNGQNSYGYFTGGGAFPFANGIVLSTARAIRAEGPNDNLVDEGSVNWAGDYDLEQALGIQQTYNATALEFDFTPLTSHISFDYIFASEEYQGSAPCHYSDGFAFLLKPVGSTAPYQNLALVPNTNTPVLVTTVHPDIGGSNGCGAENENYFSGFNDSTYPANFNGQTVVMTASATVVPGVTYHIKLVIADEENIRYDSAIFLGGGSFNVGTDLGPDQLVATNNPVCYGESYTLDATEAGSNTYDWYMNGNPVASGTNPQYVVTQPGVYEVRVNLGTGGCVATGIVTIEYSALPTLADPAVLVQCDDNGDGISNFDLTRMNSIITMSDPNLSAATYYLNQSDAQNQINPITNPTSFSNAVATSVIARVENQFGCANYATLNLQISNNAPVPSAPVSQCDNDQDGIMTFNLTGVTTEILTGLPAGLLVEYYASESDALAEQNQLPINFTNTQPQQQIIYARIINGPDCYGIVPVTLQAHTFALSGAGNQQLFLCGAGDSVTLAAPSGYTSYLWNTGETSASIVTGQPGTHTVTITNSNGCQAVKTFEVTPSGPATITGADIHDFSSSENSITVEYTGNGDYEFSIDGATYQSSPTFNGLAPGEYSIYVNDVNGCGVSGPFAVVVMDYPHYFTPNGDGIHDLWEIKFLDRQPKSKVNIFDRYGKLIYSFHGGQSGWDGRRKGVPMPSTDYWFTLELPDGRVFKSHFALKR